MLQTNAAMGQGTAVAVRWLVRVLLVIAGAVLGTTAAWLISDATASATQLAPAPADTQQSGDEPTPVTDRVVSATDDLTWGASDLVGNATATTLQYGMHGGPVDAERGEEAAADVRQTVHSFTRDAVLQPIEHSLGTAEHISRKPQDAPQVIGQALTPPQGMPDFGKVWEFLRPGTSLAELPGLVDTGRDDQPAATPVAEALPAPVAKAVMGPVMPDSLHGKGIKVAPRDSGASRHDGDQRGEFPFSPLRGPLAPAGIPLVPGGAATGGHIDGLLFGVPAGSPVVRGSDDRSAVRFAFRHMPVQPGEQPGVTPD